MESEKMLTTPEVAERLGISIPRIHQLIKAGRLPSKQYGRSHLIAETDLALVAERPAGRPKKESATNGQISKSKKPTAEQLTLPVVPPAQAQSLKKTAMRVESAVKKSTKK